MGFKKFYFKENSNGEHQYSSVQVNFPEDISKAIMDFGAKIPDKDIYTSKDDPSLGRETEPHATILYGIHSDSADEIRILAKDIKPFDIELGDISFFEGEGYDVMKIDLKSFGSFFLDDMTDYLCKLNEYLRSNVHYTSKWPEYKPHATIAYIKKNSRKALENNIDKEMFKGIKFQIREMMFCPVGNPNKITIPLLY